MAPKPEVATSPLRRNRFVTSVTNSALFLSVLVIFAIRQARQPAAYSRRRGTGPARLPHAFTAPTYAAIARAAAAPCTQNGARYLHICSH